MVAPSAPAGFKTVSTWKAELQDKRAFLQAVLDGAPGTSLDYIEIDMKVMNALAKAQKKSFAMPGIVAVEVEGLSAKGR